MVDEQNPYEPPATRNEIVPGQDLDAGAQEKFHRGEKLVVLATFDGYSDAQLLVAELERHGIPARLGNVETKSLGFLLSAFWIEVLVIESDANRALKIKEKINYATGAIPEWVCACGETVDEGFEQCWSCMAEYPGQK